MVSALDVRPLKVGDSSLVSARNNVSFYPLLGLRLYVNIKEASQGREIESPFR